MTFPSSNRTLQETGGRLPRGIVTPIPVPMPESLPRNPPPPRPRGPARAAPRVNPPFRILPVHPARHFLFGFPPCQQNRHGRHSFFQLPARHFGLMLLRELFISRHILRNAVGRCRGAGCQQHEAGRKKNERKTSFHHPVNSTAADGRQGGRAAFRKNGDKGIRYFDIKARFSRKYIIGY